MKRKLVVVLGVLVLVMAEGCSSKTSDTSTEVEVTENGDAAVDMLSAEAYTPVTDAEGNTIDCGNLAADGTVHLDKIYEETNAVVISMVWDGDGYENTCEPLFNVEYASSESILTGYGCGTGYYDEAGNLVLANFYEEHEGKVFDTVLVLAKDGVSVTLEPSFPSNDSPIQAATVQVADANGVRTLSQDDIYTRGETGIWYDAICTVKDGLAEAYEF